MVNQVLDYTLKLFNRAFLISALVPCLIFSILVWFLIWGIEDLVNQVQNWTGEDWTKNLVTLIIYFLLIYLFAFTLHGLRPLIQQIFYGQWMPPFTILSRLKLKSALRSFKRNQRRLWQSEDSYKEIDWVRDDDFTDQTSDPATRLTRLDKLKYRILLFLSRKQHHRLISGLKKKKPFNSRDERKYWRTLSRVRRLQIYRRQLPGQQKAIARLVRRVRSNHSRFPQLKNSIDGWKAEKDREYRQRYNDSQQNYPVDESWLQPTQLGNIGGTLEEYSLKRYGINFSSLWPRLIYTVPKEQQQRIEESSTFFEYTIMMSFLSLAGAGIAAFYAYFYEDDRRRGRLIAVLLCILSFWVFYKLAVQALRTYVAQLQATIDLFHLKLLDNMEFVRPASLQKEIVLWKELKSFFGQALMPQQEIMFREFEKKEEKKTDDKKVAEPESE